jgi:hypothetical protein
MTNDYAADQLFWPNVVRAFGLEVDNAGSASALFNMMRNIGGTIGIAALQTLLTEREQLPQPTGWSHRPTRLPMSQPNTGWSV